MELRFPEFLKNSEKSLYMENTPADNGAALNPMENDVSIVQNPNADFSSRLESILFTDKQIVEDSESTANPEEAQTEDKAEEGGESLSGDELNQDSDPKAEDGNDVLSNAEEQQTEPEVKSEGFQKRIDRLTFLRKQAEEQVEKLTEEVNTYKEKVQKIESVGSTPEPTPENPFADLTNEAKVRTEYEQAKKLRYMCEENPHGFQIGETHYGSDDVHRMRINSMRAMEDQLPRQLQFIRQKDDFDRQASTQYPWWSKPETQEYKLAQEVMKSFKGFRNYPDQKLFVGDYVAGLMMRSAKSMKAPSRTGAPNVQVKPTSAKTASGNNDTSTRTVTSRYAQSQNRDDLKKAVSRFL